jgi:MFS family permease
MTAHGHRRDYMLLLAASFFWGTAGTQLTLLAAVLRQRGISEPVIAVILSSSSVSVVVAAMISGVLVSRIGVVQTLALGALISCTAIAALPFAVGSLPLAALAKAGQGFGFGLFTPAGQLFAKSRARREDQTRAVARFTAMTMIPSFFGPSLGEWSLRSLGEEGFFLLAFIPIAIALAVVRILPRDCETAAPPNASGYLRLLRDRAVWLPNAVALQSGLAYGFAYCFLPLMLIDHGTPVAAFFGPFAIIVLTTRFLGLKYLQRLAPPHLAMLGLLAFAVGLGILAISETSIAAAVAGCLTALGYGVIHPTCVEWSSRCYPPADRARPVALINTSFHIGSIVSAQLTGSALAVLGWHGVLRTLGIIILLVMAVVGVQNLAAIESQGSPLLRLKREAGRR